MSAEQFSKLSLQETMVTTRAGAAKASRPRATSPVHEQDKPLPSIEPVSPVSPTPSLVVSTNNLRYNVSAFDSNLRRRAKRGLEDNDIRIKYCATTVDEDNPDIKTQYFYIDDDITVAMGGKLRRPRCSCGANDNGLACKVGVDDCLAMFPANTNSTFTGWVTISCRQTRTVLRDSPFSYQ
jgi:hypothetical protein